MNLSTTLLQKIARRIRVFLNAFGFSQNDDWFDWMQLRLKTEIDLFESETTDEVDAANQSPITSHFSLLTSHKKEVPPLAFEAEAPFN